MGQSKPPWGFQVELVEGCNRLCSFCGINAIRKRPGLYRYMSEDTLVSVAAQLADWCPGTKVMFAVHGEPLQHPKAERMVALMRGMLPKAQLTMSTNGRVLKGRMQERLMRLFRAGLDFILLDTYYPERDALRAEAFTLHSGIVAKDLYDDLIPRGWSPYANHRRKVRGLVVVCDDLGARSGEHPSRVVHNHAGGSGTVDAVPEPLAKTCTKPFRELTVLWDGEVAFCCEDFAQRLTMGNATTTELRAIWHGAAFEAGRAMLQNKRRDFGGCRYCDASGGMRVGLLPKYPPVTAQQEATLREQEQATAPRFKRLRKQREDQ